MSLFAIMPRYSFSSSLSSEAKDLYLKPTETADLRAISGVLWYHIFMKNVTSVY
jgi:hypothetical protein